jgi:hypothetical protein
MNFYNLPRVAHDMIIGNLTIRDMVSLSETCKHMNKICHEKSTKISRNFFSMSAESILCPEYFLPNLTLKNYIEPASAWKNIIFYMMINNENPSQMAAVKNYVPSNIMVSFIGRSDVDIDDIHSSIEILDCPWKIMNCPREISHNLKYLNISEQFYIPSHIDFSGKSLITLNMTMCRLTSNHRFNFSKTLKSVNMFGCSGLKSLEGFENVETLNIDYCDQIESVEPLKSIKKLSMRHCEKIKDVSCLTECEQIDVSFTNITDVSALKKLKTINLTGIEKMTFWIGRHDLLTLS